MPINYQNSGGSGGAALNAASLTFDDTSADLDPNAFEILVQEAIEKLDDRLDIDDATHFRPENVLSAITNLTPVPSDGWHLFEGTGGNQNELVLIDAGAITDTYTPKVNDTIIIDNLRKDFDGTAWIDFEGGSKYWVNKVTAALDTLPATGVTGDRFLLKPIPPAVPVIKVWDAATSAFVDEEFCEGAHVSDGLITWIRRGDELDCENQIIKRDRIPNFCDNFPIGFEWENSLTNELWKLVSKGSFGTTSEIIGNVHVQSANAQIVAVSDVTETWQSFTPSVDGTFNRFQISGAWFSGSGADFILTVYEGQGVGGSQIHQETLSRSFNYNTNVPTFVLDCPVQVFASTQYTYSIKRTPGSTGFVTYIWNSSQPAAVRDYLPGEISSSGAFDLLNRVYIDPGSGNNWLKIEGLINVEQVPDDVSTVDYSAIALVTTLPSAALEVGDTYFTESPPEVSVYEETTPGNFAFVNYPLTADQSVLIGAGSATRADEVADFDGTDLTYRLPNEVKAIIKIDTLETCVWRDNAWQEINPQRIIATSDLNFYIDDVTGSDTLNQGSQQAPFRTTQGAIAKVAAYYDFDNQFGVSFFDESAAKSMGQVNVYGFVGIPISKKITYQGRADGTTNITATTAHLFNINLDDNDNLALKNLTITGASITANGSFLRHSGGIVVVDGLTFTGACNYPIQTSRLAMFNIVGNSLTVDNFSARSMCLVQVKSRLTITANVLAKGVCNFIVAPFQLTQHGDVAFANAASMVLDAGATVTADTAAHISQQGAFTIGLRSASDVIWGLNTVKVLGSGQYNNLKLFKNYCHWIKGLAVSIKPGDPTKLIVSKGEYVIFVQNNRQVPYHLLIDLPETELDFPAVLNTVNQAYIVATINGYIFITATPAPAILRSQIYRAIAISVAGAFDSVSPFELEGSPEDLDTLSPAVTPNPSGYLKSALMTNLNDSQAGEAFVFDISTANIDTLAFAPTPEGLYINPGYDGFYDIRLDFYGTVPANGAQRAAPSIKVTIDNVQQPETGTSYIRRAAGTNECSANVFGDRVYLGAGSVVGGLGFRDGQAGTVTSPAGLCRIKLLKVG